MKTKQNPNSPANQMIKQKFVEREVKACFSYEMEAVFESSSMGPSKGEYNLPTIEDIENLFERLCPECGSNDTSNFSGGDKCNSCGHMANEFESEPQEILEWWIVTKHLYTKLKDKGEPVLEWGNNYYWGRTCSGQAIMLDGVISSICAEMEILDGQKYSCGETPSIK